MKPRFVAPSQTLEKSLKEQIERKATNRRSKGTKQKKDHAKESRKKKEDQEDEEDKISPDIKATDEGTNEDGAGTTISNVDPHSMSITDEEKQMRIMQGGSNNPDLTGGGSEESSTDERSEISMEQRPFLQAVFHAMDCNENDYLALFALCLIYAMQQNSGKMDKKH